MSSLKGFYKGKKILITGGLGFLGSSIARRLVGLGSKVTIIDSLRGGMGGNLFNIKGFEKKVRINISDVRDKYAIESFIKNQDILFNLAGTLSHIDSMNDPFTDLQINCESQLSILEAVRRNNPKLKILYAGTRNQYGKPQYLPVDEGHPLNPTDINGINCNAGESYHILYYKVYKIKSCSLRMTNTFGPRHQMRHSKQGVLNWFIRQIMEGKKVRLHGGGKEIRDVNYLDDVVRAFLLAGASDKVWGEVFNLGGEAVSLKEFVTKIIQIYKRGKFVSVPRPKERQVIEVGDYIADYSKIKKVLGWGPEISIAKGIAQTIKFYEKYKKYYW